MTTNSYGCTLSTFTIGTDYMFAIYIGLYKTYYYELYKSTQNQKVTFEIRCGSDG